MLPEGFEWREILQDSRTRGLFLRGSEVARLAQKVGGQWYAILRPYAEPFSPIVTRDCETFETGRAGVEAWVCRHEAHLREQEAMRVQERHSAVRKL